MNHSTASALGQEDARAMRAARADSVPPDCRLAYELAYDVARRIHITEIELITGVPEQFRIRTAEDVGLGWHEQRSIVARKSNCWRTLQRPAREGISEIIRRNASRQVLGEVRSAWEAYPVFVRGMILQLYSGDHYRSQVRGPLTDWLQEQGHPLAEWLTRAWVPYANWPLFPIPAEPAGPEFTFQAPLHGRFLHWWSRDDLGRYTALCCGVRRPTLPADIGYNADRPPCPRCFIRKPFP